MEDPEKIIQDRAIRVVVQEREYQDHRWGTIKENPHEIGTYLLFIEDYIASARHHLTKGESDGQALEAVRKIAALALACMEEHGIIPR